MIPFKAGDIVLLRIPFTDLSSTKKRPALIINAKGYSKLQNDVVLLALTSQPQTDNTLRLSNWKKSGLPKPTWIKPVIGTFAESLIDNKIGRLTAKDHPCVKAALERIIAAEYLPDA